MIPQSQRETKERPLKLYLLKKRGRLLLAPRGEAQWARRQLPGVGARPVVPETLKRYMKFVHTAGLRIYSQAESQVGQAARNTQLTCALFRTE
jgi:hypothetical protein